MWLRANDINVVVYGLTLATLVLWSRVLTAC